MKLILLLAALLVLTCALPGAAAAKKGGKTTFEATLKRYVQMVKDGASPPERIAELNKIFAKYKSPRYKSRLDQLHIERNYLTSWLWYMNEKASGAAEPKRYETVKRILGKYRNSGVDLFYAQSEYKYLNALLEPPTEQVLLSAPLILPPTPQITPEPLLEPPTHAATPSAVLLSTVTAEPPIPAKPEPDPPMHFGVAGYILGSYGLYGYEGIINFGKDISVSLGQGSGTLDQLTLDSHQTLNRASEQFLFRYGKMIYLASGIERVTTTGTVASGPAKMTGSVSNNCIPLVFGFESSSRGRFFGVHAEYDQFYGDLSTTLSAVDPVTGDKEEMVLEQPRNGMTFGIGLGVYLF